jgi:integrase
VPKPGAQKAKAFVYPDEERLLLSCAGVPLSLRLLYGFLAREGMRKSEALALTWADLDLKCGTVSLDENKSDDPRTWALGEDVVAALRVWRDMHAGASRKTPVVVDGDGTALHAHAVRPDDFRAHLRLAGVTRPQLFERTASRQPIRIHDLRGTFVTLALAEGRSETWVADRTGHKSSQMINRYRRAARSAGELGLGWLAPLSAAIPELATDGPLTLKCSGSAAELAQAPLLFVAPAADSVSDLAALAPAGHEGLEPAANGLRGHWPATLNDGDWAIGRAA